MTAPTGNRRLTATWNLIREELQQHGMPTLDGEGVKYRIRPLLVTADALEEVLRTRLSARIHWTNDVPVKTLGGSMARAIYGSLGGASLTVHVHEEDGELVADFDLQEEQQGSEGGLAGRLPVGVAYQICDNVLGSPDRAPAKLVAGYVAHRLSRMKGKRKAELLAELLSLLADDAHENLR